MFEHTFDNLPQVGLAQIADRLAPATHPRDRVLPVPPPLDQLFPGGGLRRGGVVGITGSTTLALALAGAASTAGLWAAVVGRPHLGSRAAAEVGVDLNRLALVPAPGEQWATAVAALVDAIDLVLVCPPARPRAGDARRLAARARERGAVLVVLGEWPEAVDVRLRVASVTWEGIGHGHGRLRHRTLDVVSSGRGAAARERRVTWSPSAP